MEAFKCARGGVWLAVAAVGSLLYLERMPSERRLTFVALLAVVGALVVSVRVRQPEPEPVGERAGRTTDPTTGRVLVDLDDDTSPAERDRIEGLIHDAIAPLSWPEGDAAMGTTLSDPAELYALEVPPSEVSDVLRALRGQEAVEAVEVERQWRLPKAIGVRLPDAPGQTPQPARGTFVPNDPYYKHQWHLDKIQMPKAWLRSRGRGVIVAVVDTGVAYGSAGRFRQAPDLAATRFVPGRDFVDNDDSPFDEHGHGTHVAGTIAQSTNNGVGVAGVAPEAAIMPIRVLDRRGAGSWGSVAAGIRWAADHGADVINLSLGGSTRSRAISNAIAYAHRKGVVVVAAAGNTGRGRVQYPGADRFAIGVGAVRYDETLSFYSSYGRELDLVAPGGDLRVDQNGDGLPDGVLQNTILRGDPSRHDYLAFQGTSMAAPHVAGVAALLKASGVSDPSAVERILEETAKPRRDRRRYGAGLVQADRALRAATRDLGASRGAAALGLSALFLYGLWWRRRLGVRVAPVLLAAGLLSGLGSAFPWELAGLPSPAAPLAFLGALGPWGLAALAALPLLLVGLLYGVERLRPWIAGACFGIAGFAVTEALCPTETFGGWLAGPVLVLVAAGVALLGRQVALRRWSAATSSP